MTDHFQDYYRTQAEAYDALVACEDAPGHLFPALQAIHDPRGQAIVEFGAGTGRLTRLLAPHARELRAFETSPAMLAEAARTLAGFANVTLTQADHARLPVPDGWADLAVEGWSFGHAVAWHPDTWPAVTGAYLEEMRRVVAPGGTMVLIETLGTDCVAPAPPNPGLGRFYGGLEARGFQRVWVRTDFRFDSAAQAEELCRPFFGRSFDFVPEGDAVRLPECTGLWWKVKA